MVTLNSDMTSVDTSSFYLITGLGSFRESIAVFKYDNYYYFHWSCDDTGSENYNVKYGTASSLKGKITNQGTVIQKDSANGILATGHQSVVQAGNRFFLAYHRFYTPLSVGGNVGHRRETCIEEITFKSNAFGVDRINAVTPTYTGVGPVDTNGNNLTENLTYPTCTDNGSITGSITLTPEEAPEIRAFSHNWYKTENEPTCTEEGFDSYLCTICLDSYEDNFTPATGHDYGISRNGNIFLMQCYNCDNEKEIDFSDYINLRNSDAGFDSDVDRNGDGIINAKDFALLIKESE